MADKYRILVINPGSTSTKVAVFDIDKTAAKRAMVTDENKILYQNIKHTDEELKSFSGVMEQRQFRHDKIMDFLRANDVDVSTFSCVMSRGGMIPPCHSGAYTINRRMVDYMYEQKNDVHISNVGCAIAYDFAEQYGIPAYIYDPVTVDELEPIARVTGLPELPKRSRGHALNSHAMAHKCATEIMHKPIEECTFIVQHLGGGTSVWLIHNGKAIDMYSDDDAGFAPERCGKLQAMDLIKLCYSGKYTLAEMSKKVRGNAGFKAHFGTSDAVAVENMALSGDENADLVYRAFAYGIAKGIGDLATVVSGKVDRIILTGGIAHSKLLTEWIEERVKFIAPVVVMAGEHEMEALAEGGLRVMLGREKPFEFDFLKVEDENGIHYELKDV